MCQALCREHSGSSKLHHPPPPPPSLQGYRDQPHFTVKERNAQRGSVTFRRSQSQQSRRVTETQCENNSWHPVSCLPLRLTYAGISEASRGSGTKQPQPWVLSGSSEPWHIKQKASLRQRKQIRLKRSESGWSRAMKAPLFHCLNSACGARGKEGFFLAEE